MAKLYNRAKMTTATTGTGTITLGSAVSGYQSFASAGVQNGDVVSYVIEDNNGNVEFGTGTYTSAGTTLSRTVTQASISGTWGTTAITLSGTANVYISPLAADLVPVVSSTPPTSPMSGQLWWDQDNGKLKIYYTDANTSQWVDAFTGTAGPNAVSTATATNITGLLKGASGSVAQAVANTDYLPATGAQTTGDFGIGIANDGTQILHIAAGTASKCPLEFNAGTLMTSPDAGSMEYDGAAFYLAPFGGSRGVVPAEQLVVLGTAYTLTSQTAAQKMFNASTNGAVAVEADTYWFECGFSLTSMSATSGSYGFALGGTAVIASQGWRAWANKAALATATAGLMTYNTAANTTLATANTTTTGSAFVCGFVRITTAGTLIPQVSLGVAAAAVVGAQSYFRIFPVSAVNAAATNIAIGNWS